MAPDESTLAELAVREHRVAEREAASAAKLAELDRIATEREQDAEHLRHVNEQLILSSLKLEELADQAAVARTERAVLEAKVEQSLRLASLGTLAAGVAHEINNPLAFASANVAFALQSLEEKSAGEPALGVVPAVIAALREAVEGVERVARIVDELRGLEPVNETLRKPVNVARTAMLAVRSTRSKVGARGHASVRVDVAENLFVQAGEGELTRVLANLLSNALDASVDAPEATNQVSLHALASGSNVVITVSDTGSGMSPEVCARVFDPFFSTKGVGEGMGLGLALVHSIVTSFGGSITVTSELGRGTSLHVTLPAASPPADAAMAAPASPVAAPAPAVGAVPARVLIIDDEPMLRRALQRSLSRRHSVELAAGGAEGFDAMQAARPPFDVVFCDVTMPEVSGPDVWARIEKERPELLDSFVFISGGATDARSAAFLAATSHLLKPCSIADLEAAIASVLARRAAP